jgi:hypothetical protein
MNAQPQAARLPLKAPPTAKARLKPRVARDADYQAHVTVVRCAPNRGVAGVQVLGSFGTDSGEHFIPFELQETPSQLGRDFGYAGMLAALQRLRTLGVRRVVIQTDDAALVDELDHRTEPHGELTLPYIMLGCKLNEFARARIISSPAERLAGLRAKTSMLALSVYQEAAQVASAQ